MEKLGDQGQFIAVERYRVLSRRWLECESGVISGLFHKP